MHLHVAASTVSASTVSVVTASGIQPTHLVVIDPTVPEVAQLAAGVIPGHQVCILDSHRDGIAQITELLHRFRPHTLHLISHGAPGLLHLGNSQLSLDTLDRYTSALQTWFTASDVSPSLLLYGCQVAAGDAGREFLDRLHVLTGASIAASSRLVGNPALGGSWDLEQRRGDLTPQLAFQTHTLATYSGVFNSFLQMKGNLAAPSNLDRYPSAEITWNSATAVNTVEFKLNIRSLYSEYTPAFQPYIFIAGFTTAQGDWAIAYNRNLNQFQFGKAWRSFYGEFTFNGGDISTYFNMGAWTHFAVVTSRVYDFYGERLTSKLYINGIDTNRQFDQFPNSDSWLLPGQFQVGEEFPAYKFPLGLFADLDEIRFWTYDRSIDDIRAWKDQSLPASQYGDSWSGRYLTGYYNFESTYNPYVSSVWGNTTGIAPWNSIIYNDNQPPTAITLSGNSIPEDMSNGSAIGTLGTVDPNSGDTFTYTLVDNAGGRFSISGNQLRVANASLLDFEAANRHTIRIRTTDQTGLSYEQDFVVNLTNINEVPTAIALSNASVAENAPGAIIGAITVTDPDAGNTHSLTVNDNRFEIVGGQLKLKNGISLDQEATTTITVGITATDQGGLSRSQNFTLTVTNVNEAPTAPVLTNLTVAENVVAAVVSTVSATDPDAGDTLNHSVSDNRFEIVDGQLKLKDGISLDYETEPNLALTLTTTDAAGLSTSRTVTLTVLNSNDAPTNLTLDQVSIDENSAGGIIGNVNVVDSDSVALPTFSVDDNRFEIVDGQLKLKDGISLNYETTPSINLTLTAGDDQGASISKAFVVTVNNLTENAPTVIALTPAAVNENVAGVVIGTLTATDADAADRHSFTVDDNRFEIVNNQLQLKAGISLDRETEPNLTLNITATDLDGLTYTQAINLTVTNVNEAPTAIDLDQTALTENQPGGEVGNLSVSDIDVGETFTYAISDDRFEVVDGQLKLKAGISLNFETEPTVNLTVMATDAGGLSFSQAFGLSITNANEAPGTIGLDQSTVAENSPSAVIGTLSAIDPDAGDSFEFSVSDSRFEVIGTQLKLKDGVSLNFETEPTVAVVVTATDSSGLAGSQSFTLSVTDVNDAPTAVTLQNPVLALAENTDTRNRLKLADLVISDDALGQNALSLTGGDANSFEIVGDALYLKAGVTLDFETKTRYEVTVQLDDPMVGSSPDASQFYTLLVTQVNDAPTAVTLQNAVTTLSEAANTSSRIKLADLAVSDDIVGVNEFSLTGVDAAAFEIIGTGLFLKAGAVLDFETKPIYDVTIQVDDRSVGASPDTTVNYRLSLTDANDAPTAITLVGTTVAENAPGAVIGTVTVTDADTGDSHSFSVSDDRFEVINRQLKLKQGISLNYETAATLLLTLTAIDRGGISKAQSFTVTITDANDAPTNVAVTPLIVLEKTAGAGVGTVSTTDEDNADTHRYSVSDNRFEVVNGQLKLKDNVSVDHAVEQTITLDLTTTDQAGAIYHQALVVAVVNTNEVPTAITLSNQTVAENAAGATVGLLTTTDPDLANSFVYSVSDNRFEVVNSQLKLKQGSVLDFETEPSITLAVTSTDQGGLSFTQPFTLSVTDANDAPIAIRITSATVAENAAGAVIGSITGSDPDQGDQLSFTVADERFEVVNGQLKLKNGISLNYEATPQITLNLTARDRAGLSLKQQIALTVSNVNEAPTVPLSDRLTIDEHIPPGTVVALLSATDPDAADLITYSLVPNSGDNSRFEIVGNELRIKESPKVNRKASYQVIVRATDRQGLFTDRSLSFRINDVQAAPTDIMAQSPNNYGAPGGWVQAQARGGTLVANLSATDPDEGEIFTYRLLSADVAPDNAFFAIEGNQLRVAPGEQLRGNKSQYRLRVRVTDSTGLSVDRTIPVYVWEIALNPNQSQTVAEFIQGRRTPEFANTLQVKHPLVGAGEIFTYELLTNGPGSDDMNRDFAEDRSRFSVSSQGTLRVAVPAGIDFEKKQYHRALVRAVSQQTGAEFIQPLTIGVDNRSDAPSSKPIPKQFVALESAETSGSLNYWERPSSTFWKLDLADYFSDPDGPNSDNLRFSVSVERVGSNLYYKDLSSDRRSVYLIPADRSGQIIPKLESTIPQFQVSPSTLQASFNPNYLLDNALWKEESQTLRVTVTATDTQDPGFKTEQTFDLQAVRSEVDTNSAKQALFKGFSDLEDDLKQMRLNRSAPMVAGNVGDLAPVKELLNRLGQLRSAIGKTLDSLGPQTSWQILMQTVSSELRDRFGLIQIDPGSGWLRFNLKQDDAAVPLMSNLGLPGLKLSGSGMGNASTTNRLVFQLRGTKQDIRADASLESNIDIRLDPNASFSTRMGNLSVTLNDVQQQSLTTINLRADSNLAGIYEQDAVLRLQAKAAPANLDSATGQFNSTNFDLVYDWRGLYTTTTNPKDELMGTGEFNKVRIENVRQNLNSYLKNFAGPGLDHLDKVFQTVEDKLGWLTERMIPLEVLGFQSFLDQDGDNQIMVGEVMNVLGSTPVDLRLLKVLQQIDRADSLYESLKNTALKPIEGGSYSLDNFDASRTNANLTNAKLNSLKKADPLRDTVQAPDYGDVRNTWNSAADKAAEGLVTAAKILLPTAGLVATVGDLFSDGSVTRELVELLRDEVVMPIVSPYRDRHIGILQQNFRDFDTSAGIATDKLARFADAISDMSDLGFPLVPKYSQVTGQNFLAAQTSSPSAPTVMNLPELNFWFDLPQELKLRYNLLGGGFGLEAASPIRGNHPTSAGSALNFTASVKQYNDAWQAKSQAKQAANEYSKALNQASQNKLLRDTDLQAQSKQLEAKAKAAEKLDKQADQKWKDLLQANLFVQLGGGFGFNSTLQAGYDTARLASNSSDAFFASTLPTSEIEQIAAFKVTPGFEFKALAFDLVTAAMPITMSQTLGWNLQDFGDKDGRVYASDIAGMTSDNLYKQDISRFDLSVNFILKLLGFTVMEENLYQTPAPRPGGMQVSGQTINKYIGGATIFFDANFNAIQDENEALTFSDMQGRYLLDLPLAEFDTNQNGQLDPNEGRFVSTGGMDVFTSLPIETILAAPAGYSVISPVNTLVSELAQKMSLTEAQAQVKVALGLPNVDLATLDPVAAVQQGDTNGAALLKAHVQINSLITLATSLIAGVTPLDKTLISDRIIAAIAEQIQPNQPFSLSNVTQIQTMIQTAVTALKVDDANNPYWQDVLAMAGDAAQVISNGNQLIEQFVGTLEPGLLLQGLAKVQKLLSQDTREDLQKAAAGLKPIAEVLAENSLDALMGDLKQGSLFSVFNPVVGTQQKDSLKGTENRDLIAALEANDTVMGGAGDDLMMGNDGEDVMTGDSGDDSIKGGKGNDELNGGGGKDSLTGNQGKDTLIGGDGDDVLSGEQQADTLISGKGKDCFQLHLEYKGVDKIRDFARKQDVIEVVLPELIKGLNVDQPLKKTQLRFGLSAKDRNDFFIYNRTTGALYFDANGSRKGQQLQIADLGANATLTHQSIDVVTA